MVKLIINIGSLVSFWRGGVSRAERFVKARRFEAVSNGGMSERGRSTPKTGQLTFGRTVASSREYDGTELISKIIRPNSSKLKIYCFRI